MLAKNEEVKKLKKQLERENQYAKVELLLKKRELLLKHAGRFFIVFSNCVQIPLFYSNVKKLAEIKAINEEIKKTEGNPTKSNENE